MKMFALALALMLPTFASAQQGKSMGNPNAPLRMDLFDDFTCPHCKMLHEQMLPRIISDFVTPGKAYLVFHEFTLTGPGHEHSKTASMYAAAAARVGKYMAVCDALFATQSSWAVSGKVWEAVAPALSEAERKKVQALMSDPRSRRKCRKISTRGWRRMWTARRRW
jgi:protein-disulfide isomerase